MGNVVLRCGFTYCHACVWVLIVARDVRQAGRVLEVRSL